MNKLAASPCERSIHACIEICQTSANFQLSDSFHDRVYNICAAACKKVVGLYECIATCKACAKSAWQMPRLLQT